MDQVERSSQLIAAADVGTGSNSADVIKSIDNTLSINGALVDETVSDGHLEKPPHQPKIGSTTDVNGKKTIFSGTELFDNLEPT